VAKADNGVAGSFYERNQMDIRTKNKVLKAKAIGWSNREISRAFKVSVGSVSSICNSMTIPIWSKEQGQPLDLPAMMGDNFKVFSFPDMHIPDHDPVATRIALKAHAYFKPDVTIVGNDFVQCTPFQRHNVDNMKDSSRFAEDFMASTVDPANKMLDKIQDNTKLTVFQQGNHDAWIERWAASNKGTEKAIYNMVSLEKNLASCRADFVWMPTYGTPVKLHDDRMSVHGWSYSKHAANQHLIRSKTKSVMFHHTHRMQSDATSDNWSGDSIEAKSAGCLCLKKPTYGIGNPTDWVHGFWVSFVGKHSSTAYAIMINKGKAVMPDGKEIKS